MATLQDFRDERLRKLGELKTHGVNPYPAKANRTHDVSQIVTEFDELENQTVTVAGRIMSIRKFGKMAFIVVRDMSGQVQLFIRKGDSSAEADRENSELIMPNEIALLDTGDFVECRGEVIKTQTGEISLNCRQFRLLTKALRPMPSAQEGFTDKEQRLRRRYVDMNVNTDVRQRFERRSTFWRATRDFLNQEGFLEVNIPVLEHTTGGADANPFVTHMDALDQDFYLRISHELPLKRLIGAGFEKVYDLGPRFRNENYSDEHLPEHIAMEWYWAYADWKDGMPFMERMFRHVLEQTFGTLQFNVSGMEVDMSTEWEHWDYAEVIKKHYDIDVFDCTIEQVQQALKDNKLEVEKTDSIPRGIDKLWKKIRATVAGPVWLINTPAFISPLSKSNKEDPRKTERAQAVIAGSELINMFSELNDPVDQLDRFVEQQQMRDGGDDEAMMLDIDYIEMLEYGIPPTCGMGYSERVFWIFEGVTAREGVPFPQLRSEVDEVTKSIYPALKLEHTDKAEKNISASENFTDLPESAAEYGTKKLYLDDYSLLSCDGVVQSVDEAEDGKISIVLNQTCMYPGGGGQAADIGHITWSAGSMQVDKVLKDDNGLVSHVGQIENSLPKIGETVQCRVNPQERLLNSRLHSAGHLLDLAVQNAGYSWSPGKGAHYPHMAFVEYSGEYDGENNDLYINLIQQEIDKIIDAGGSVSASRVTPEIARKRSKYIPESILKQYKKIHLATYNDNFDICCGGTHVTDIASIKKVNIDRIKKKSGNIRVSYSIG